MIIETERLLLRPFVESDAADVYEYLKEPAVNCFASMKLNSLDEAVAEVKNRTNETEYHCLLSRNTFEKGDKLVEMGENK